MPIEPAQWYTLSAKITNGPKSWYGNEGKREVTHTMANGAKIVIEFEKSSNDAHRSDVNRGQIPELTFTTI